MDKNILEMKIIIFDLDDTLVSAKMTIPRQTYHMLNKFKTSGYIIGIITYNCMVNLVAKECNLYKYTRYIFYGNLDRYILFDKCISSIRSDYSIQANFQIYYLDDRQDNLECVKKYFPFVITYHCVNIYELYKFKHLVELFF